MINIWIFEWLELALGNLAICHKNVVADFHETTTIAVRMTMLAIFWIVRCTKIIKHFAIWTTWITYWCMFWIATTAPPVFATVIKKDSSTVIHTLLVTILLATNVLHAGAQTFFIEQLLPYFRCFGILCDIVFGRTDKARHVQSAHIQTYNFV